MHNPLRSRLLLAALSVIALSHLPAQTPPGTVTLLTTYDYPKSLGTYGAGINDAGEVVGSFAVKDYTYGYERLTDGTLQLIIDGGMRTGNTGPSGINDAGLVCGSIDNGLSGFFYDSSRFTLYGQDTSINGINNAGDFVGSVGFPFMGFASIGGNYIPIDIPDATYTVVSGINNHDEIVGVYTNSGGHTFGFYRDPTGKLIYPIQMNHAIYVGLYGINDAGDIVGHWETLSTTHGLVMKMPNHFASFDVPGAYLTFCNGINSSGEISGAYFDYTGTGQHAFLAQLNK